MAPNFQHPDQFSRRHIGPNERDMQEMLRTVGAGSLDELIEQTVPAQIRLARPLEIPPALSEHELLEELQSVAGCNRIYRSFIGMGYSDCITPPVILRNI